MGQKLSTSTEFKEYVIEQLAPVGPIRLARFFGGIWISYESVQFAMIVHNSLYFVVDDKTRDKYEQAGMQPFSYQTKKGTVNVRRYYELPEEVLTDAELLVVWVGESIKIAQMTKQAKKALRNSLK